MEKVILMEPKHLQLAEFRPPFIRTSRTGRLRTPGPPVSPLAWAGTALQEQLANAATTCLCSALAVTEGHRGISAFRCALTSDGTEGCGDSELAFSSNRTGIRWLSCVQQKRVKDTGVGRTREKNSDLPPLSKKSKVQYRTLTGTQ